MADLSMKLSPNFQLKELLRSDKAERDEELKREQENPPDEVVENLRYVVEKVLQPLRTGLDFPIRLNSGYRCPGVNKAVGGSSTSQHCLGEAADLDLSSAFLTEPRVAPVRERIQQAVQQRVGRPLRDDLEANFYLFASICLQLDTLDVDQVIHEYGEGFGQPAWIHVSASRRQSKRQILFVGSYTNKKYLPMTVEEALLKGT